ncbi:MAG TPA: Crp/Fnr family transcriptional regulator [Chitinophaga sp.]
MKTYCVASDCQLCEQHLTSILCRTNGEYLDQFNQQKVSSHYKKGQVIFNEGAYPFGVYCIHNGKIKLSRQGDDGREHITRLLRGGDVLGYRALLSGSRYNASAVVLEDTQVCFIPKDLFFSALKNDAVLSLEIMKLLSTELQRAEMKITHLAQKPVRERLAEALLFIRETYGYEADGATLNVRLSREEIANLVGTATESTIRLLSEFKREGLIDLDGKKISFINVNAIVKTANLQD